MAFALYFYNYSTFLGKPGLYLEDLYVMPEMRGKGIGKVMLAFLANTARERGCGRFEWSVLDWNEPAIKFYRSIGALPMEEWTVQRIEGAALSKLAESLLSHQNLPSEGITGTSPIIGISHVLASPKISQADIPRTISDR